MHDFVLALSAGRFSLIRGLTFELSGRRRQDARPGLAKMYRVPPDRAWWLPLALRLSEGLGFTGAQVE